MYIHYNEADVKKNKESNVAYGDIQRRDVPCGIDPSAIAALPTDLAKEVLANQKFHQRATWKKTKRGIEQYFYKK